MDKPAALPCDYDSDPERWVSRPSEAVAIGDVHQPIAERLSAEGLSPVIDIGSGYGRLGDELAEGTCYLGIEISPTQIARSTQPVVRADALHLPVRGGVAGAVAALYMLYHVARPGDVVREALRVLKPGGLFVAATTSRFDSPEVQPPQDPTPFNAQEAPDIIGEVFADVEVERWDAPMITLSDREAVRLYLRSRCADPELAEAVDTPVSITKRGCIVWGRKA